MVNISCGKAKIDQLNQIVTIDEDIVQLKIAMSDVILMHISDCGEELPENIFDANLRHSLNRFLL